MKATGAVLTLCFAMLVPASARAEDPRVTQARKQHQDLAFEDCVATLAQPPPATSTELERAEAEVLDGVCSFELGRRAEAQEHFRQGLRKNPRVMLPPYSSPKIVEAFEAVRADIVPAPAPTTGPSVAPEIPRAAAPSEAHAETPAQTKKSGPPLASLLLAGGAVVFAGAGTYGYLRARGLESDANNAHFESDAYEFGARARDHMIVANVGLVGAVVCAATAVVVWLGSGR